ncbi:hypothetical protein BV22DRAFT_862439 [Leucogyrophana mollusca]|uniref:Uncharacterized protein n=1 Tax=Leucogyrophana mollusca TaxID=85980 RepID=A0ACB8B154_9AGAM|nr:hypothetical protein BV22DRAFT_862439 [Leucogyrophana mollusca]
MPLFKKNKNTASNEQMQPAQQGVSDFDRNQNYQGQGGPANQGSQNFQGHSQGHNQDPLNYSSSTGGATGAGGGNPNIPPPGHVNHQDGGGGSHAFTGRVEHAVGSMIGSNALKAKGMQKQQEANSISLQGEELAAAENLEREALMRRERAVAHGAHPVNKHLGGNPATGGGLQDTQGGLGGQQQGGGFVGQQQGMGQGQGGGYTQQGGATGAGYGAQAGPGYDRQAGAGRGAGIL